MLGIRPERIKLSATRTEQSLPFRINLVEELGSQKIIHGSTEGDELTVAFPEDTPLPSEAAFVNLPSNYLHFFDARTGRRMG